jgi:hypothetical protein
MKSGTVAPRGNTVKLKLGQLGTVVPHSAQSDIDHVVFLIRD